MANCTIWRGGVRRMDLHSGLTPLGRDDSAAKAAVESVLSTIRAFILLIIASCDVLEKNGV